ncbi:glycoside hydrolase family 88/105 protein [Paenibacillus puerhi]|uniref:glycoside hydrolase family 88/105 protein n=1 Tax=Paenibacillus puerhi TaxID=2692622 RepID=UPI0013571379|nr:glycoside hydrolase family 88 protein [Paenibacillus puerhi]
MKQTVIQPWSVRMAQQFMNMQGEDGYHPELIKRWAYVPGMMLKAIQWLGEWTGDPVYAAYAKKHMDLFVREDGSVRTYRVEEYNLDQINQGKLLFTLWKQTGDDRYAKAADLLITQVKSQPRTSEGGFWHKKIYPFQMWLDGLYMATPFVAEYAAVFQAPELFDEAARQLLLVEKKTRDQASGLLYHGWDESGEQMWCDAATGKSRHFWSRAMGWYAMAVVDALEHFPADHPQRGTIVGIFERMCHALERVQDANGLWHQVLNMSGRPGNYPEASGSCMFVYALAKGLRLGYLSGRFRAAALAGYEGIVSQLIEEDEDGLHLTGICHGAGLGGTPYRDGSYEYYVGEAVVRDAMMGVAPFLLASMEIEKLKAEWNAS